MHQVLDNDQIETEELTRHFTHKRKIQKRRQDIQRYYAKPSQTTLREKFEREHPASHSEIERRIQELRFPHPQPPKGMNYDIFNCPDRPPLRYPMAWNAIDVLSNWNPDNTAFPDPETRPGSFIYQGLCAFDWNKPEHRKLIDTYREHEAPFIMLNHPQVQETAFRWTTPNYLENLIGTDPQRNEYSHSNHFMFWRINGPAQPFVRTHPDWVPLTKNVKLTYKEWSRHADEIEQLSDEEQVDADHWYFRLNGGLPEPNPFLYDELPFFQPTDEPTLFMVDSGQHRGINCKLSVV